MSEREYWLWLAEALHYNPKQIAAVCRQIPSVKEIYDLTETELSAFRFLSKAEQEALSELPEIEEISEDVPMLVSDPRR